MIGNVNDFAHEGKLAAEVIAGMEHHMWEARTIPSVAYTDPEVAWMGLSEAEAKAQEHYDAWLRAKAEAENIRKRSAIELANAYKYAIEAVAADLLPVKDSLEATLAAESAALETLKSGVELTLKQLNAVFAKATLKEINPIGEKFDPHRHQAISMLPSEKEPNTVINVLQKGYSLHDRVIRPALVTVAKPKNDQA